MGAALLVGLVGSLQASAADPTLELWPDGGHIRVLDPANLDREEAERIYKTLQARMIEGYERSGVHGLDYREWYRLNTHPYLSDQHGARLVNTFVSELAEDFHKASRDDPLPPGAKVIKDSISVVASGGVSRGPLFLMEKMPDGFDPENGNWRYTMIMPNGKLFGTTGGQGSNAVTFCAECHAQAEDRDFLFELPAEYLVPE